jgi:hypothetical protein
MQGPFAKPMGLFRKEVLSKIPMYTRMFSALSGSPLTCGRTAPFFDTLPQTLPVGNYCIGVPLKQPDDDTPGEFLIAVRLVFMSGDAPRMDCRIQMLWAGGAVSIGEAFTYYDADPMATPTPRRGYAMMFSDHAAYAALVASKLFPPPACYYIVPVPSRDEDEAAASTIETQ